MVGIGSAIWAESLKVRKSKMFWLSILAAVFMAAMLGFMIIIAGNPELAAKLGLLGSKSSMLKYADWPAYMGLLCQIMSALGLIGYGFVISWMFGREYSDRTVKDLLALPFPRSYIVVSKLIVVAVWSTLLSFVLLITALLAGLLAGLPGGSYSVVINGAATFGMTALLALIVSPPVAFFASYGRGYLPPMGYIIITILLGQFSIALGVAQYFPWAVPGLYSMAASGDGQQPGSISYVLLVLVGIAGIILTYAWWRYADQH